MCASRYGHKEIAQLLVEYDPVVNAKNKVSLSQKVVSVTITLDYQISACRLIMIHLCLRM